MPLASDHPLASIGIERFYREYWQQKPLFIKNALPALKAPLEANELAGLSCEEEVSSRIVTGTWAENNFRVEHGPIAETRFDDLGDKDWTLLVQDVDKLLPAAHELLERFNFLPAWRLDDLMISFAAAGGSVGPHTDEYDVFLVQLEGQRRWQIAETFQADLCSDLELKVLQHFDAEQEWVCEPGDLLYLPPQVAHYGVALSACMTASVGLRAPSLADLLDDLANHWAEQSQVPRYRDRGMSPPTDHWQIDDEAVERMRQFLTQISTAPEREFKTWLGACMSRFRLAHQLLEEGPVSSEAGAELPAEGIALDQLLQTFPIAYRQRAARLHWLSIESSPGQAILCANGDTMEISQKEAQIICQCDQIDTRQGHDMKVISFLINSGAFVLDEN